MREESCGLKSLMLEVRGGTRDTNKGCEGAKKRRDQRSEMGKCCHRSERKGKGWKEEQMRGERGGGAA